MKALWAIARNLMVEIIRMRMLMAFVILATACYTIFFAWWIHGSEGPANEKIQTFLSYSLSLTAGFLSLLTIFISISTITRDIKRKEIFTIATKPITRGNYLLGKFLGMALLNIILLVVSAGTIYGLARYLQRTEPTTQDERDYLNDLVFVARQALKPQMPDVSSAVRKKVNDVIAQKLRDEPERFKNNPTLITQMRASLARDFGKQLIYAQTAVPPSGHIVWHFTDIDPIDRENGNVYIRYKQDVSVNPPDLHDPHKRRANVCQMYALNHAHEHLTLLFCEQLTMLN